MAAAFPDSFELAGGSIFLGGSLVARIKGTALVDTIKTLKAIKKRGGQPELERVVGQLGAETRKIFDAPVKSWDWYSIDVFAELLEALVRETANGNPEILTERSEQVVDSQLRGVYRIFLKLGSPGYVIKRIAAVHETYFDGIQIIPEVDDSRQASIKYVGFKKRHAILQYTIIGFFRKALELSGAKQVKVNFKVPMSDDAAYSEVAITWA
jgi:hypothetical protein